MRLSPGLTLHWRERRTPWLKRVLFYVAMVMVPVVIFGLIFLVAKSH
jgi:hypothetical protein